MRDDYRAYERDYQVLPVPDGYDQRKEVIFYIIRNNPSPVFLSAVALVGVLILVLLWRVLRGLRRRMSAGT
jgi:hypothetical protein